MKEKILELIYNQLEEINSDSNDKIPINEDVILYGKDGFFDSLEFVNFIIDLEMAINEEFNTEVTLANESAFTEDNNPFENPKVICEYIEKLIKGVERIC